MKFVNSDLTVLPKMNSLSDAFNSSQLKVVHMGAYQIEETAFLTYIWATSVLSQINSPVTCHKRENTCSHHVNYQRDLWDKSISFH